MAFGWRRDERKAQRLTAAREKAALTAGLNDQKQLLRESQSELGELLARRVKNTYNDMELRKIDKKIAKVRRTIQNVQHDIREIQFEQRRRR